MTEDIEKRLKEIEALNNENYGLGGSVECEMHHFDDHVDWLLTTLRESLAKEKVMRKYLEDWHCPACDCHGEIKLVFESDALQKLEE